MVSIKEVRGRECIQMSDREERHLDADECIGYS